MIIINERYCKGCGICIRFCPKGVLELSDRINVLGYRLPRVIDLAGCTNCRQCELYCPDFCVFLTDGDKSGDG